MTVSPKGRAFIAALEGSESQAYRDVAGHWTIGIGHRITQSELTSGKIYVGGEPVRWRYGLSARVMDEMLAQDLKTAEAAVNKLVDISLRQHEFDALTSFTFNVGTEALASSTLLKKLNRGDRESVPSELARWYYAGGRAVNGLRIRRKREGLLFERGDYAGVIVDNLDENGGAEDENGDSDEIPGKIGVDEPKPMPPRPLASLPVSLPETHRQALARATPAEFSAMRQKQFALLDEITQPEPGRFWQHPQFWLYVERVMASDAFKMFIEGAKLTAAEALLVAGEIVVLYFARKAGLETDDGGVQ